MQPPRASHALTAALALGMLLPACAGSPAGDIPAARGTPDGLAAVGRWSFQGASGPSGRPIAPLATPVHAIALEAGTLRLEGGCNRMSTRYRLAPDGDLLVERLASTRMACADAALMDADTAMAALLEGRASWIIAESWPEQLTLRHADGSRSHWVADRPPR